MPRARAAQAADGEAPAREPLRARRMAVDPAAPPAPPPRIMIDPLAIEGASFYDAVGRPDLASEYRTRHAWAVGSRVVGGISLGLGALTWVAVRALEAGFTTSVCSVGIVAGDSAACQPPNDTLWVPDLMMAGGLALLIVPAFWSNDPVGPEEKVELARDAVARSGASVSWNLALSPAAGGQGGTLSLSGRF